MGRSPKNSVQIVDQGGMLRLRWTYQKKRFVISLGLANTPLNYNVAQGKASAIESDIRLDRFDPTLRKYKNQPKNIQPEKEEMTTPDLFQKFIDYRRAEGTSGQAIASRYIPLLNNLKRWGHIADKQAAKNFIDLLRSRQSALIANQNLSLLKGFNEWAIETELMPQNVFRSIKPLKNSHAPSPKRQPFTVEETRQLISTLKKPKFQPWHDFCMFLLYTGCRPSEAIGLQWGDIDWTKKTVIIQRSLSRGQDGKAAGYARQSKTTKNQKHRTIDLHPSLVEILQIRTGDSQDLVFKSPKGKPIDDHTFSQRVWKSLCKEAGIPYRVPYAARHSLGSHLVENGASIPQTAAILGNTPQTTARHYTHMIDRPTMPTF